VRCRRSRPPIPESDHRDRRRHGEPKPGGKSSRQTGPQRAEGDADLAARRAGEELTKRDDIDVSRFIQPFAALDEFPPEIAKMRDRPAEARKPEPQKDEQHFEERPASRRPPVSMAFLLAGELMPWAAAGR